MPSRYPAVGDLRPTATGSVSHVTWTARARCTAVLTRRVAARIAPALLLVAVGLTGPSTALPPSARPGAEADLPAANLLVGAAKHSIAPRPNEYGGTWETDPALCRTLEGARDLSLEQLGANVKALAKALAAVLALLGESPESPPASATTDRTPDGP